MRIAILVAYADREPFKSLRSEVEADLHDLYSKFGTDLFFVSGRITTTAENRVRDAVERIRWSKFHWLLRIVDYIVLARYKRKLPLYQNANHDIKVNVPEDIRHLTPKLLSALQYLSNFEYDWIVRTTLHSLVNPASLLAHISQLKTDLPIMGGRIVHQADGTTFVSGSFMLFNRKSVELFLQNIHLVDFGLIDDVALSRLGKELEIKVQALSSIDVRSLNELCHENTDSLKRFCHLRFRSEVKQDSDKEILVEYLRNFT